MKPPAGRNVAIVTNSGALTSLASEAVERCGLIAPVFSTETQDALRAALPDAAPGNPFDTKRTLATPDYVAVLRAIDADPQVDLVLVAEEAPRAAGVLRKERNFAALNAFVANEATKPFAVFAPVTLAESEHMKALRERCSAFPWMRDLGKTLRAIAAVAAAQAAALAPAHAPSPGRADLIARLRAKARALQATTPLSEPESKALLAAYGIAAPSERVVQTPAAAAEAARAIGFPVVVKAVASAVPHKSDAGLVMLGLRDAEATLAAARTVVARCAALGAPLEGLLVAQQIEGATEMALGLHRDPELGPALMVGMGGVWLELFHDAAFAAPTLDRAGARAAIARTRAATLLEGYRGGEAGDVDALADAMVALGVMAQELGDSLEAADVNPVAVLPQGRGVVALDALVILTPPRGEEEKP